MVQAPVRVVTHYDGPDVYGRNGIIIAIDQHFPYPYAVNVKNVLGYPNAVRNFACDEIEPRS